MAKSRAEIQRQYRERKKEKNIDVFLAKERCRVKKYYIPSTELSASARKKRNANTQVRLKRHRNKKKAEALEAEILDESFVESSGYDSAGPSNGNGALVVRFPFPNSRRNGPKNRISRALKKVNAELKRSKVENESLRKKLKTTQRILQRSRKPRQNNSEITPNRKTNAMLRDAGISPRKVDTVRKQLLLSNVIVSEVAAANCTNKRKYAQNIRRIISGKIVKKYKCIRLLSKVTGISRNSLTKTTSCKLMQNNVLKRQRICSQVRESVLEFLSRQDNCRVQPGKKDSVKSDGERKQTAILTDYLSNLHQKYLSENEGIKISLASFCRLRPKHILLASFLSRNACLCTKHQNMALKLRSLKNLGIAVTENPEHFLQEKETITLNLEDKLPTTVKYSLWKRVQIETKLKMKIVQEELPKTDFIELFNREVTEFESHVYRVKAQYKQSRTIKEFLPANELIICMDFAENYSCKSVDEIQSAYWNKSAVTLHPNVVYYRDETGLLCHKSFVAISDELSHSSATVLAIIKRLIPLVTSLVPALQKIHYWTDSPTSQYRNKFIFDLLANHRKLYSCDATWNYFEAGHGKGPCDGLGGTSKRMADDAVRTGKAVIQDAVDFFEWAQKSTMKKVRFFFVSKEDCANSVEEQSQRKITAVKGTMKLHAVMTSVHEESTIYIRDTSCYCGICIEGTPCETWKPVKISPQSSEPSTSAALPNEVTESPLSGSIATYKCDQYIAAVYDNQWFVGKIISIDDADQELEVSFMQVRKNLYQWPFVPDVLWIKPSDILSIIQDPVACGKSKRMFKIDESDLKDIESKFNYR